MNTEFKENGYLIVRGFLPKDFCKFAQLYFKIRQDALDYEIDVQCPESKSFYGDPFCDSLLLSSCKKLSEITGLSLIPTYSYTRVYAKDENLVIHRDRPECQYSATLCLGRPDNEDISAIYMSKTENKEDGKELLLEEGDLCIYMGTEMYHWREPFKNSWYLQTFLHYVDKEGPYSHTLYDGRRCLGIRKG